METTIVVVGVNCCQMAIDDTNADDLEEKYLQFRLSVHDSSSAVLETSTPTPNTTKFLLYNTATQVMVL